MCRFCRAPPLVVTWRLAQQWTASHMTRLCRSRIGEDCDPPYSLTTPRADTRRPRCRIGALVYVSVRRFTTVNLCGCENAIRRVDMTARDAVIHGVGVRDSSVCSPQPARDGRASRTLQCGTCGLANSTERVSGHGVTETGRTRKQTIWIRRTSRTIGVAALVCGLASISHA